MKKRSRLSGARKTKREASDRHSAAAVPRLNPARSWVCEKWPDAFLSQCWGSSDAFERERDSKRERFGGAKTPRDDPKAVAKAFYDGWKGGAERYGKTGVAYEDPPGYNPAVEAPSAIASAARMAHLKRLRSFSS